MDWLDKLIKTFLDFEAMWKVLPQLLGTGLVNTLIISVAATVLGIVIGMILAVMGVARTAWLRVPARIYTDIFRGLPAILTILLIGQGFASISRQIFGPSPYPLGILALSLIAGAYIGEIFRAGIQSVDRGQYEASKALGMTYLQTMRRVVLPQMVRRVLPPVSNETITLVKDTSLIYVLALNDILRTARGIVQRDFTTTPFLVAAAFYLLMTLLLTWMFQSLEKRYAAHDQ